MHWNKNYLLVKVEILIIPQIESHPFECDLIDLIDLEKENEIHTHVRINAKWMEWDGMIMKLFLKQIPFPYRSLSFSAYWKRIFPIFQFNRHIFVTMAVLLNFPNFATKTDFRKSLNYLN